MTGSKVPPATTKAPALSSGQLPDLRGQTLRFVSFGGNFQDAQAKAWLEPFATATGLGFSHDSPVDYLKLRAQVQSGDVTSDVVHADAFFVNQQRGRLFEPLDPQVVDRSRIDPDFITNRCGVPVTLYGMLLTYDPSKFAINPPESWGDFFDTRKFPGKRSIWRFPLNGLLEAALLADAVPPSELYPLDVDRAFGKLDAIKQDIAWADSLGQQIEQMVAGTHPLVMTGTAELGDALNHGAQYAFSDNQVIRSWDNLAIVKGSRHKAAAQAFLNYVARSGPQKRMAELVPDAPTTLDTRPKIDPQLWPFFPSNPKVATRSITLDQQWWAQHMDEVTRRFADWQTG